MIYWTREEVLNDRIPYPAILVTVQNDRVWVFFITIRKINADSVHLLNQHLRIYVPLVSSIKSMLRKENKKFKIYIRFLN